MGKEDKARKRHAETTIRRQGQRSTEFGNTRIEEEDPPDGVDSRWTEERVGEEDPVDGEEYLQKGVDPGEVSEKTHLVIKLASPGTVQIHLPSISTDQTAQNPAQPHSQQH